MKNTLRVTLVLLTLTATGSIAIQPGSFFGGGPVPNPTCGPDGCGPDNN